MDFEEQLKELQENFPGIMVSVEQEGGCRFLRLSEFFVDKADPSQKLSCLFGCDSHLGYDSRLWFPKQIQTVETRNWNAQNTYILGSTWFAFSYKAKGTTLSEKLLCHLGASK